MGGRGARKRRSRAPVPTLASNAPTSLLSSSIESTRPSRRTATSLLHPLPSVSTTRLAVAKLPRILEVALRRGMSSTQRAFRTSPKEYALLLPSPISQFISPPSQVTSQVNELNINRQSLYDLKTQPSDIREQYEDDVCVLHAELNRFKYRGTQEPLDHECDARERERDLALSRERKLNRECSVRERDLCNTERDHDCDVTMGNPGSCSDALGREALGRPPIPGVPVLVRLSILFRLTPR